MNQSAEKPGPACRFCGAELRHTFVDLGMSPLCESYLTAEQCNQMEPFYPLHVWVCQECFLVQLEEYAGAEEIFTEYAYFSSYSDSWLKHAQTYATRMIERLGLGAEHLVVEVGSNDGYLLQYFAEGGVSVLGVEPAANVVAAARAKGIPTLVRFFGAAVAGEMVGGSGGDALHEPTGSGPPGEGIREPIGSGRRADLIAGNNVLAQVPDLNDFVEGIRILLKPGGVCTFEFPHLERLMAENQFDTIYHEHFSYFSFRTARRIFATHGLTLFDVEELPTHGGSLRVFGRHADDEGKPVTERALALARREEAVGVDTVGHYAGFAAQVRETKRKLLEFLIRATREGKSICGYGAPGKGNTLLNYCGVRTDFLEFTVDRSPYKQGKFLPGTHIPIHHPDRIRERRPDYVLILPWNLKDEIMSQLAYVREWGGRFVVPIPEVKVLP